MLTREHALIRFENGQIIPDRLTFPRHARYVQLGEAALAVYRGGVGRGRQELHRSVERVFAEEADCPARRVAAFCKLLDERSQFDTDRRGDAARLRRRVFALAAPHHPLVARADRLFDADASRVKGEIAAALDTSWEEIENDLFTDVIELQRLLRFDGYADGRALLARYNVAQVQVALYDALEVTIHASRNLKEILRAAKLAGLLHECRRAGKGHWELRLDGPASVLRETRRYGVAMAGFLPSLLVCQGWSLTARIRTRFGSVASLQLSSNTGLRAEAVAPPPFDSSLERQLSDKWGSERRDGWRLERETEIIARGQSLYFPDFVLRHEDGTAVLLEIAGFWTPEYLEAKRRSLSMLGGQPMIVVVPERIIRRERLSGPFEIVTFKTAIRIPPLLEALERLRRKRGAETSAPPRKH